MKAKKTLVTTLMLLTAFELWGCASTNTEKATRITSKPALNKICNLEEYSLTSTVPNSSVKKYVVSKGLLLSDGTTSQAFTCTPEGIFLEDKKVTDGQYGTLKIKYK